MKSTQFRMAIPVCAVVLLAALATMTHAITTPNITDSDFETETKRCAFVTLITGNDERFIRGGVVLGRSIRNTGTMKDMVCLYHGLTHDGHKKRLEDVGWKLVPIKQGIAYPKTDVKYHARFVGVFNKLEIFGLSEYKTVVYVDADALVTASIDELCEVNAEFGAVMRGSLFNSGILVLQPNTKLHNHLIQKLKEIPTVYPVGDQGLLNAVYHDFNYCPFIDPLDDATARPEQPAKCARIPVRYNADLGIYALNKNTWPFNPGMMKSEPPKILHFTFVDMKPWDWWSYLLTPIHTAWWRVYVSTLNISKGMVGYDLITSAWVVAVSFSLLLVSKSKLAQRAVNRIYLAVTWKPVQLVLFLAAQLLAAFISLKISTIRMFSPTVNFMVYTMVMASFMDLLLFEHMNSFSQARDLNRVIMLLSYVAVGAVLLVAFEESLTFFVRLAILLVAGGLLHLILFPYCFLTYVGRSLADSSSGCRKPESPTKPKNDGVPLPLRLV